MGTDRTISSPGATFVSRCVNWSACSLAPPRYMNTTLSAFHSAVPTFLTSHPTVNCSSGGKMMLLLGDCQINLQSNSLCIVGVGGGEGTRTVGVSDGLGFAVAAGDLARVCVGCGAADMAVVKVSVGTEAAADVDAAGVSVCSKVAEGRGLGDRVRLAIFEGDGMGVLLRAAVGAKGTVQAAKQSARPRKSNAFLIVVFAFCRRRIAIFAQAPLGLWPHLQGFVAQHPLANLRPGVFRGNSGWATVFRRVRSSATLQSPRYNRRDR